MQDIEPCWWFARNLRLLSKCELLAGVRRVTESAADQELLPQPDLCDVGGIGARLGGQDEVHEVREATRVRLMERGRFPQGARPWNKEFLKYHWCAGKELGQLRSERREGQADDAVGLGC